MKKRTKRKATKRKATKRKATKRTTKRTPKRATKRATRRRKASAPMTTKRKTTKRRAGGARRVALMPPKTELYDIAAAGVAGVAERKALEDEKFVLNSAPKLIQALGWSGNIAVLFRLAYIYGVKHPALLHLSRGFASAAAYTAGRRGAAFSSAKLPPTSFEPAPQTSQVEPAPAATAITAPPSTPVAGYYDEDIGALAPLAPLARSSEEDMESAGYNDDEGDDDDDDE